VLPPEVFLSDFSIATSCVETMKEMLRKCEIGIRSTIDKKGIAGMLQK